MATMYIRSVFDRVILTSRRIAIVEFRRIEVRNLVVIPESRRRKDLCWKLCLGFACVEYNTH